MLESHHQGNALENNRQAWNRMAASGHVLARPATDEELKNPLKTVDPVGWLGKSISGWNVLCLAAGGGRHGPLYAAAGGNVTVVDLSPGMLELDRELAQHYGLSLKTVETSMDNLGMLPGSHFDLVIHPVSSCYLPTVTQLFREVGRVTRPGGLYISQHKQPTNLQASLETRTGQYVIEQAYYDSGPVRPASGPNKLREPGTREFVHSLESILGGICRNGFQIEDVTEPRHGKPDAPNGSFGHRCYFIAPYIRIKARRSKNAGEPTSGGKKLELFGG